MKNNKCFIFLVTGSDYLYPRNDYSPRSDRFQWIDLSIMHIGYLGYLLNSLVSSIPSLSNSLGIEVYVLILVFVLVSV